MNEGTSESKGRRMKNSESTKNGGRYMGVRASQTGYYQHVSFHEDFRTLGVLADLLSIPAWFLVLGVNMRNV